MPRDDLYIDFVRGVMPPADSTLDPASILDEWANRVSNLPEEINFVQNEIADKDRQALEVIKKIEDHDGRIQKWIKTNGSHTPNPQEAAHHKAVVDNFAIAEQLAKEKIALTLRLQTIMDKHLRHLDSQIKMLYDRGEPGFNDPDELPSILRTSPANSSAPSARSANPSTSNYVSASLQPLANPSAPLGPKGTNTQLRNIQTTQLHHAGAAASSSSAPVSPAASMILKRGARETSAGPGSGAPARPRLNTNLSNLPNPSSGLARHSSLGPGTPKGHSASAGGHQRSGSAGPGARAGVKGGSSTLPLRKGTPSGGGRGNNKKSAGSAVSGGGGGSGGGAGNNSSGLVPKSGLQRVRKTAKNSTSSAAESELSDADSVASSNDSDAPVSQRGGRGTPMRGGGNGGGHSHSNSNTSNSRPPPHVGGPNNSRPGGGAPRTKRDDHHHNPNDLSYADDDEGNDDRKYCLCQKVSFGDMVACDNPNCEFEWFHWSCVGLKSEPTGGEWYCPKCVLIREGKA